MFLQTWLRSLRYRDYALLPPHGSNSRNRLTPYSRWTVIFVIAVLASFGVNVYLLVSSWVAWPSPLDNYQKLNTGPLVDQEMLNSLPPIDRQSNAIVTTLYTSNFAAAVATLGHSLKKVDTKARLILLYLPDKITAEALCIATSSGFVAQPVIRIPPPRNGRGVHRHFQDQYTKLSLWTLDQQGIDAVVYLDADTLVKHNLDELFRLPHNFAAVPDIFLDSRGFSMSFNAGVMFLRPSTNVFNQMVDQIGTASYRAEDAEQSFLNHFYGAEAVRLPYVYNGNQAIRKRSPKLWEGLVREMRVVHFTMVKPFLGRDYKEVKLGDLDQHVRSQAKLKGGIYKEEVLWWGDMWLDVRENVRGCGIDVSHSLFMTLGECVNRIYFILPAEHP